jgi:hypothetical protein
MLMLAFGGLGATVAETGALDDNLASIAVSRSFGYEPNGEETHDHEGTPARLVRFRLAREAWDTTVRPAWPTRIEGLERAGVLFGLDSARPAAESS